MGPSGPLSVLRERNFLFFASSRLLSGAGMTLQQAAIAWQVYEISGSPLQLGLIGLARFLPSLGMSLIGGAVADTRDRRTIVMVAQLVPLGASGTLWALTVNGMASLPLIYGLVMLLALASAFENPARQALLPQLVPVEVFARAVTVVSTVQQLAFAVGPTVAGLAIAHFGVQGAYAVHVGLIAAAILALMVVRVRYGSERGGAMSVALIVEGVRFVLRQPVLLGAMALDMFAVIFAGAQALLPVYAEEILKVGSTGYGVLTSAQAVGAFVTSFALMVLPPVERTGRMLILAVAGYGVATIVFGLSRSFPLSVVAYALTGATDQISVVMRQTTIQLATPDALRGRVSSVNQVFIGASNQLGMVESGLVATVTNATFAVVSGGIGCLATLAAITFWVPELWRYRIPRQAQPEAVETPARMGRS